MITESVLPADKRALGMTQSPAYVMAVIIRSYRDSAAARIPSSVQAISHWIDEKRPFLGSAENTFFGGIALGVGVGTAVGMSSTTLISGVFLLVTVSCSRFAVSIMSSVAGSSSNDSCFVVFV